jgi:hypothetical protein
MNAAMLRHLILENVYSMGKDKMERIIRTIRPEIAAIINEDNIKMWNYLKKELYESSPIWRELMDANKIQSSDT